MRIRFIYYLLFTTLLLFFSLHVKGQDDHNHIDTLKSSTISTNRNEGSRSNNRFSPGTRSQQFNILDSELLRSNSLSDYLKANTALNIKEYGRGAGSYISLRGTSSSHTAIHWNGLDVSLPTLGQTDLSHIPLYFFDDMNLHIGGNSVLYGNGSIGGTITLNSTPKWQEGISGDILLTAGSYNTLFTGATLRACGKKWESRSSLFFTSSANNFYFTNNTKPGYPKERLNNAAYRNYGALQEIFHKPSEYSILSLTLYYLDFHRDIQPSVSNNDRPEAYKSIYDRNFRVSTAYKGSNRSRLFYNANLSYSNDYELYEDDVIASERVFASGEIEYRLPGLSLKSGALSRLTSPHVHSYSAGIKEWNNEVFILANYSVTKRISLAGGLRKSWVTDSKIPLMPSVDVRFKLVDRAKTDLTLRVSTSKSTKIPTLNDKYWGGVTTTLKPEIGKTFEGGLDMQILSSGWRSKLFLTLYHTDVSDWIKWLPVGDIWRPYNIARVLSKGVESGIYVTGNIDRVKTGINILYAFNSVVTKESERTNDPTIDKQLPYQPRHTANANINVSYNDIEAVISLQYTGKRSTGDIFDILPAYLLADLSLSYTIKIKNQSLKMSGRVKNILNEDYQNVKFFSMPGRNFEIAIQYLF